MNRISSDVRTLDFGGGTTMSFSFTVSSDADSVLLAMLALTTEAGATNPITGITFNGVAIDLLSYVDAGNNAASGYRLAAPTVGSHTVVITKSPGVTVFGRVAMHQVSGVHATPEYEVQSYNSVFPGQTYSDFVIGANTGGLTFDATSLNNTSGSVTSRNAQTVVGLTAEWWGTACFSQKLEATLIGYGWADWTTTAYATVIVALKPVVVVPVTTQYWQVPTNAADGTVREMVILATDRLTVVDKGAVTAAAGVFSRLAADQSIAAGTKKLAFIHEWDGTTTDASIYGGAALATIVSV